MAVWYDPIWYTEFSSKFKADTINSSTKQSWCQLSVIEAHLNNQFLLCLWSWGTYSVHKYPFISINKILSKREKKIKCVTGLCLNGRTVGWCDCLQSQPPGLQLSNSSGGVSTPRCIRCGVGDWRFPMCKRWAQARRSKPWVLTPLWLLGNSVPMAIGSLPQFLHLQSSLCTYPVTWG